MIRFIISFRSDLYGVIDDGFEQASEFNLLYQRRLQSSQVKSYFYGGPALSQGQLSPFKIVVKFDDLTIYRIGEGKS